MTEKKTRYGFPSADWDLAKAQATDFLVRCARTRSTTTYSQLCEEVGAIHLRPYSFAIIAFLDEICAEEDARHGVVTASLVVRKDTGMPGNGYFGELSRLGHGIDDREAFWRAEVERVWDAYSD